MLGRNPIFGLLGSNGVGKTTIVKILTTLLKQDIGIKEKKITMNKHFREASDMGVMLGRSMRHIFRSLDTIITVTITPIAMMLLFVYVFGGAIQTGTDNYVNYLINKKPIHLKYLTPGITLCLTGLIKLPCYEGNVN